MYYQEFLFYQEYLITEAGGCLTLNSTHTSSPQSIKLLAVNQWTEDCWYWNNGSITTSYLSPLVWVNPLKLDSSHLLFCTVSYCYFIITILCFDACRTVQTVLFSGVTRWGAITPGLVIIQGLITEMRSHDSKAWIRHNYKWTDRLSSEKIKDKITKVRIIVCIGMHLTK